VNPSYLVPEGGHLATVILHEYYAAFQWAWKLVFTSFPVGIILPLKSEVVFPSGKLGILQAPQVPTFHKMAALL